MTGSLDLFQPDSTAVLIPSEGAFEDVDTGETRSMNKTFSATIDRRRGSLSVTLAAWEHDDETQSDRNRIRRELDGWVRKEVPNYIDLVGKTASADWRLASVDVDGFCRSSTMVRYHPLLRESVQNRWIDNGTSLTLPLGKEVLPYSEVTASSSLPCESPLILRCRATRKACSSDADCDPNQFGDFCEENTENPFDADNDGRADFCDNCPNQANAPARGTCIRAYTENPDGDLSCPKGNRNCPAINPTETCTSDLDCFERYRVPNGSWCSMRQESFDGGRLGFVCDTCVDFDNDGRCSGAGQTPSDNCVEVHNPDQADSDGDGFGDACDPCPGVRDVIQSDPDGDGRGDNCDNCRGNANPDQSDRDGDGLGDVCDRCPDTPGSNIDRDRDGWPDECDNCVAAPNDQTDSDGDGRGDICDLLCPDSLATDVFPTDPLDVDVDGDWVPASCDPCPLIPQSLGGLDVDGDGVGDLCDNCRQTGNPSQADSDGDALGDACDVPVSAYFSTIELLPNCERRFFPDDLRRECTISGDYPCEFDTDCPDPGDECRPVSLGSERDVCIVSASLFGRAIASLGDLDGDGTIDLAITDSSPGPSRFQNPQYYFFGRPAPETVRIYFGALGTGPLEESLVYPRFGFANAGNPLGIESGASHFGAALASLGDLDGDGTVELAVGASGDRGSGGVWILSLKSTGAVDRHKRIAAGTGGFTGALAAGARFGTSLARLDDLDGDGIDELAVGSAGSTTAGHVWVLFLNEDGTVRSSAGFDTAYFPDSLSS